MSKEYEFHNLEKLDNILVELCQMVIEGKKKNPELFGMVAACVLDMNNNKVCRINVPANDGKRIHAERVAIDAYTKEYGEIEEGSIIITTLSPCSDDMNERHGDSCSKLIAENGVHKVYCGYIDPSQHHTHDFDFVVKETTNESIRKLCKKFADTFLGKIDESITESTDTGNFLEMLKKFLPIAVKELQLQSFPKMKPVTGNASGEHPSFGGYIPDENAIEFSIDNRHPIDILRTLAHELVHCKQREDNRLKHDSGETGSDEENEANARAGVIMRNFDIAYPEYFAEKPLNLAESDEPFKIKLGGDSEAAKAWIQKVYSKYPQTWQNNHVMPMGGEGENQQFAMFELIPSMSKRGAVEVKWFQAYPLRQGVGSRAMAELQSMAKEDGIALTLFPWEHGQVSQAKLTKFYKGHGFKPVVKGSKSMSWSPEGLAEVDTPPKKSWDDYGMQTKVKEPPKEKVFYGWNHYDKEMNPPKKDDKRREKTLGETTDYAKTNIAYHDTLCPIAFQDGVLIPQVRAKLLEIAKVFVDYLDIENFQIADIVLTGSLANYNYTKYSDFDIHVITDYSDIQCNDLAEAFYRAKKQIWNDKHNIIVRGHEAELYVEDTNAPPVSAGVYSIISNQWLKKPEHNKPDIDSNAVNAKVKALVEQIDMAVSDADDPSDIHRILVKLYKMRRGGLDAGGEFSVENLAYKVLRNIGYIDKLQNAYTGKQDAQLSMNENFTPLQLAIMEGGHSIE